MSNDGPREKAARRAALAVSADRGRRRTVPLPDWATTAHLQAIVDNTTAVIYVKDRAGRYLLVNRQYERIFHVDRETFIGCTDDDVFPPESARALRSNDEEVMRRNEPIEFEEIVPQDGVEHDYISIKFPLRAANGDVEGICGISTDITARREAEARLRRQAQQLVSVREEERQRLSFRIHDDICQELTGVTFLVAAALRRLAPDGPAVRELERAGDQLTRVIDHLRSVARGLHPVLLRELGLAESLKALGETLATPRVAVAIEIPDGTPAVADDVALAAYRVAQEAVLNAIRHAETQQVRVTLTHDPEDLTLVVADDGRGFEPRAEGSRGLGILGMEQRAMAVGGTLAVASARGAGTRITFRCPLRPAV